MSFPVVMWIALTRAGVQPKVIQKRLGHASIKTTFDTYGHVIDGMIRQQQTH